MKAFSSSFRTKTSALKIDEEKSYRKAQSPEPKLETIPSPRSQSLPPVGGGAAKVTTKSTTTTSTFTVKTSFAGVSLGSKVCNRAIESSVNTPQQFTLSPHPVNTIFICTPWHFSYIIVIFTLFITPSDIFQFCFCHHDIIPYPPPPVYYSLYLLSLSIEPLGQQLSRQFGRHRFPRPCRLPYRIVCFCSHSSNPCPYYG